MDDQERKLKRQQELEEYRQIVSYELPPVSTAPVPGQKKGKKRIFFRLLASVLLFALMEIAYLFFSNRFASLQSENDQLKDELAQMEAKAAQAEEALRQTKKEEEAAKEEELEEEPAEETEPFQVIYPLQEGSTILHYFGPYETEDGEEAFCYGLELGAPGETQVVAAASGTVVYAGDNPSTGLTVQIDHQNSYITEYTMLRELLVSEGQVVGSGQPIAVVGNPENEDGEAEMQRSEFRVLFNGEFIDPDQVLAING